MNGVALINFGRPSTYLLNFALLCLSLRCLWHGDCCLTQREVSFCVLHPKASMFLQTWSYSNLTLSYQTQISRFIPPSRLWPSWIVSSRLPVMVTQRRRSLAASAQVESSKGAGCEDPDLDRVELSQAKGPSSGSSNARIEFDVKVLMVHTLK